MNWDSQEDGKTGSFFWANPLIPPRLPIFLFKSNPRASRVVFLVAMMASTFAYARDAAAAGAVDGLAAEATKGLGAVSATVVVVAGPLASDQPAPKGDELALRVAALVAGKIGATAKAHNQTAQLGTARGIAGKSGGLVYVQIEIAKGELRATVDAYPAQRNSWDRIRNPLPAPTGHAFAGVKIDAEVRAFLSPILLEQASVHKAKHDEGEVLAVACGDIDGDGGNEIALVSRARVVLGRIRGGKLVASKTATWASLASRAPAPLREAIGTAAIFGGKLLVGTSDRGGVAIAADFATHAALPGLPVSLGDGATCVTTEAAASALEGPAIDCFAPRDTATRTPTPTPRFDAFAAASIVARDGSTRPVVAAREMSGKLRLRLGDTITRVLENVGAQVTVGDLDQDGVAEIVTTADAGDDFISVVSWSGGEPRARVKLAAPAGVRALAICPAEERGAPALVAVVGAEVWIVR